MHISPEFVQAQNEVRVVTDKRFPALDGVRAVAILLVLMRHCYDRPLKDVSGINLAVQYVMSFGWIGVQLFFVLSGFLIGGIIYGQLEVHEFSFKMFYLRRALRILPVSFFYLAVVYHDWLAFDKATLYNFLFLNNYLGLGFTDHFWSLNVEEHFYLFFPAFFVLLHWLLRRSDSVKFLVIVIIALILFVWAMRYYIAVVHPIQLLFPDGVQTASHWQIDYFLFGVLAAVLQAHGLVPRRVWLSWLLLLTPVFYFGQAYLTDQIVTTPYFNPTSINFAVLAPLYGVYGFVVVLCAATQENIVTRILSLKVFRWIATLSYSMFIWHLLVIYVLHGIINQVLSRCSSPGVAVGFVLITVLTGTLLIALVSYILVEKPFLILRNRLSRANQ